MSLPRAVVLPVNVSTLTHLMWCPCKSLALECKTYTTGRCTMPHTGGVTLIYVGVLLCGALGVELGYRRPVLFERHAVGGEYGAGHGVVGRGHVKTVFTPENGGDEVVIDERTLTDNENAVVTYHNPLDNVPDLAHHFFSRCLRMHVTPYVVTKKTVFKWQEGYWVAMLNVFNEHYKQAFVDAGLLDNCGGELQHLISDAATMQIIRWTEGGFGMAAHNYDGDMLTDEVAQAHRSPGFITSNLIGKRDDGVLIMEFEASHGTVADMWNDHLNGKETSLNPLGMAEALIGAMQHASKLAGDGSEIENFTNDLRNIIHKAMASGKGTRDLCGATGLTTEEFVNYVGERLGRVYGQVDDSEMQKLLAAFDADAKGSLTYDECKALVNKFKALHGKDTIE
eukprot:m.124441 g.124441  ORF g.124441 m.124441 type:complete len:396 (+) comp17285_c0_seq1:159-1346(+)